jgi:hypothetical protein
MTATDETTEEVIEETTEETTDLVAETPPFLRMNHTWPNDDGRFESFTLELNLGDDCPVGDAEVADGAVVAAGSWVLDLVSTTIRNLRGLSNEPPVVVLGATHAIIGGQVQHGQGCDGKCGITPTLVEKWFYADQNTTPGTSSPTGDDRKDQP